HARHNTPLLLTFPFVHHSSLFIQFPFIITYHWPTGSLVRSLNSSLFILSHSCLLPHKHNHIPKHCYNQNRARSWVAVPLQDRSDKNTTPPSLHYPVLQPITLPCKSSQF